MISLSRIINLRGFIAAAYFIAELNTHSFVHYLSKMLSAVFRCHFPHLLTNSNKYIFYYTAPQRCDKYVKHQSPLYSFNV